MADILERKIPYLFPDDLELRLDAQNFVTAISGYPVGGGGGTIVESDFIWKPVINQDGTIGWARDTSATTPATANLVPHIYNNYWYIGTSNTNVEARGPQGETGPAGADGSDGTNGKTPELRINPSNAEWQWKYTDNVEWINLGVTASGAVGPQGQSGASGASGISPTVTTAAIPGEDGTRVTFTYGPVGDSTYIDVMNGIAGASGESGYSPTITTATTADAQHPQSGVNVTVTDIDGNKSFNIWNGIDGQGATVNLLEGDGIQITHESSTTNYTIAVSADYSGAAVTSAKTWVGQQNYLTSVPSEYITETELSTALLGYLTKLSADDLYQPKDNYLTAVATSGSIIGTGLAANKIGLVTSAENALKDVANKANTADVYSKTDADNKFVTSANITTQDTDYVMTTTGWKVLSLPGGGMTAVTHDTTLTGQGNADNSKLGVAWSALSGNTITSALSADSAASAEFAEKTWVPQGEGLPPYTANIGYNIKILHDFIDDIYLEPNWFPRETPIYADYAMSAYIDENTVSGFDNFANAINAKLDTTAAEQTYQTIAGMSNYLTTTVASQTYVSTGNILTAANNTLTGIKIGNTSYTVPTTDLSNYYTKSETSATFVQKTAVKTGIYGNVTAVSAIGDVPIKDTNLWAITGTYENNNNYQHYIENTNTFNYYTVMVHPANTSSAASWANDNIIHIILE